MKTLNFNGLGATLTNYNEEESAVKEIVPKLLHEINEDTAIKELWNKEMDRLISNLTSETDVELYPTILDSIARQYAGDMLGTEATDLHANVAIEYLEGVRELFAEGREFLLTMHPWIRYIPGSTRNAVLRISKAKVEAVREMMATAKLTYVAGNEHGLIHRFLTEQKIRNEKAGHHLIKDEQVYAACIIDVIGGAFVGTTANIALCFLCLLQYPEIHKKVMAEIEQVCKVKELRETTLDDFQYLHAFIMESMRYGSIIHITLPHSVNADIDMAGYHFEKGMIVIGSTWNVHHDEKTWGDPFTFRPERFLDDSGKLLPQSHPLRQSFLPFGTGARACKGKDTAMTKVLMYVLHILYHCEIQLPESKELPENDPRKYVSVVGLVAPSFHCRFSRRQ
jgi:cytochrome P450